MVIDVFIFRITGRRLCMLFRFRVTVLLSLEFSFQSLTLNLKVIV